MTTMNVVRFHMGEKLVLSETLPNPNGRSASELAYDLWEILAQHDHPVPFICGTLILNPAHLRAIEVLD